MKTQEMEVLENWQAMLKVLIADTRMRARLAEAIHVRQVTLQRWSDGATRPRIENIRALLKHLPSEYYPQFMRLVLVDFPELLRDELSEDRIIEHIPSEFYARVLSNRALIPMAIYRQSMQDLILQQALQHLDPDQHGLALTMVICVPPRNKGGRVRSLHEFGGLGTPPWPRHLEERPLFLGAESLIGYALSHVRPCVINSRDDVTIFPAQWGIHERSIAAFPIIVHGRLVGGLVAASAHELFFTPQRIALLEAYAHLAICIFELDKTFAPEEIELNLMPPYGQQRPYFAGYHQRVSRKLIARNGSKEQITLEQARQLVWQDLEEVLLQAVSQSEIENTL